jgi:branched-chain amino acid transport system substrate-binding protein
VQLGIKTPLYMSSGVASKKFIELAGASNAEGIMLPAARLIVEPQVPANHPQKKIIASYIKEYEGKFKQAVSTFGGHAHDAVGVLVQAIRNANSTEPKALRDALESVKGFQGTWGEFNFSPDEHTGLTEDAFVMVKIVNGDWEMQK